MRAFLTEIDLDDELARLCGPHAARGRATLQAALQGTLPPELTREEALDLAEKFAEIHYQPQLRLAARLWAALEELPGARYRLWLLPQPVAVLRRFFSPSEARLLC